MMPASKARSRLSGRAEVVTRALIARATTRHRAPVAPQRILVAHHLLLGDTLMLAPLFAKLRAQHPTAEIVTTVPTAIAPLFAGRPYGVRALPWNPRERNVALFDAAPFELALVPGDNRFAWLAAAMRTQWIVAFAGDRPRTKDLPVDALVPYPDVPMAWGDMVAGLVAGPSPPRYRAGDWPAPPFGPFELPGAPYALLHVGASSPLKLWLPERWRADRRCIVAARSRARLVGGPRRGAHHRRLRSAAPRRTLRGKSRPRTALASRGSRARARLSRHRHRAHGSARRDTHRDPVRTGVGGDLRSRRFLAATCRIAR